MSQPLPENPPETGTTQFAPGKSGNPGGRPKGLAKRVRELVGADGEDLAKIMAFVCTVRRDRYLPEPATLDRRDDAAAYLDLLGSVLGRQRTAALIEPTLTAHPASLHTTLYRHASPAT